MQLHEQVTLRAVEPQDVDSIFLWENHDDMREASPYGAPVSRQQVWEYVQNYTSDPLCDGELRLVVADRATGEAVGAVDLTQIDTRHRRACISIYIHETYRRRGYAAGALAQMAGYCADALGLHQLWCTVAVDNSPSLALFKNCGYRPAGRLRSWIRRHTRWTDALLLQKML